MTSFLHGAAPAPGARLGAALGLLLALAGCGAAGEQATSGGTGGGSGSGGAAPYTPSLTATGVAVGAAHACAVLPGGVVACWGDGAHGQLGDGTMGTGHTSPLPQRVAGLSGVVAIRAGGDTSCALLGDGTARCWGDGTFGQLGDGTAADGHASGMPVPVAGLTGAVDLALTAQNACAVREDMTVQCWGRNDTAAWLGFTSADCGPYTVPTGDGPMLMSIPCEAKPRTVPGAHAAVAVAAGGVHACMRTAGGGAACWGADHFGQLGDGQSGLDAFSADPAPVGGLQSVHTLALGTSHTCAIAGAASAVRCWGDNSFGQLGLGTDALDSGKLSPTEIANLGGAVDLCAANRTTCAAFLDGVRCWGDTSTVLAVSPEKGGSALVPTKVSGTGPSVEVRTGGSHVCARRADGTVVCWGENDRGQMGTGSVGLGDFTMTPVAGVMSPPG